MAFNENTLHTPMTSNTFSPGALILYDFKIFVLIKQNNLILTHYNSLIFTLL